MKLTIRPLIAIGLVTVLGLVGFGVYQFAGAQEGPIEVRGMDELRSTSRSDFLVCVDGAGGRVLSPSDVEHVKLELEAALATVSDLPAALRNPTVIGECPPAPPGIVEDMSRLDVITGMSVVDTPSDEVLRVYLLPQAVYEAAFGTERPYLIGSAEWLCRQDSCNTVTTALYLNDAIDSELLRKVLLAGLNQGRVEPPARQFELDDLEACDRGETPTYFRCDQLEGAREDLARLTPQPGEN